MKELPILFSGPMVKRILEDGKTQTRRILKIQPPEDIGKLIVKTYVPCLEDKDGEIFPGAEIFGVTTEDGEWGLKCPYGQPGDRLWVRETCWLWGQWLKNGLTKKGKQAWRFKIETPSTVIFDPAHPQIGKVRKAGLKAYWIRPSIHMPRWASRIDLEIVKIRVERLQDILEEDARAEGAFMETRDCSGGVEYLPPDDKPITAANCLCHKNGFMNIWHRIQGPEAYQSNPWVWVVEFKRVRP